MDELLKELNIPKNGTWNSEGSYVISIKDSNEFGKIFSKLENTDIVDEIEDGSIVSDDVVSVQYTNDDFLLNLMMDLEQELYQLIITKL